MTVAALVMAVSLGLSSAMMGAWLLQRRTRNGGWADAVWTFALGIGGVAYTLVPLGTSPTPRQFLIASFIAIWALRLGSHLALRTRHGPEDLRYAQFRHDWGAAYERRMFWFLQIQAAAAAFLALTILVAARNPAPLGYVDLLGCVLIAISYGGEALADRQLHDFRNARQSRPYLRSWLVALVAASELFLRWLVGSLIYSLRSGPTLMGGAGSRSPARHSCTTCLFMSRAFRRLSNRCCARAAMLFAPIRRARALSSPGRLRGLYESRIFRRCCRRAAAAARPPDPHRDSRAGRTHATASLRAAAVRPRAISPLQWRAIRLPCTRLPPTRSITNCRRHFST